MFLNIIYKRLTVTHLKPSCGCITSDCIFENSLSTLFFKKNLFLNRVAVLILLVHQWMLFATTPLIQEKKVNKQMHMKYSNVLTVVNYWTLWTGLWSSRSCADHHWNNTFVLCCPAIPNTIWNICSRTRNSLCSANGGNLTNATTHA